MYTAPWIRYFAPNGAEDESIRSFGANEDEKESLNNLAYDVI